MSWSLQSIRKVFMARRMADNRARKKRIRRSLWCAKNLQFHAPITADHRQETAAMETEAQATFVEGHFISTLMLAMAYCEHTLSDWVVLKETLEPQPRRLDRIVNLAKIARIFKESFWFELERLQKIRNTYAHRCWESIPDNEPDAEGPLRRTRPHTDSLTARTRPPYKIVLSDEERDRRHPSPVQLMEQDAKDALVLMDSMRYFRHNSGITTRPFDDFAA